MRAYIDSSALVKRGIEEESSEDLEAALVSLTLDSWFASTLAWIEVSRALRSRLEHSEPSLVVDLIDLSLSSIQQVSMSAQVVSYARRIGSPRLRSLDAIHLASAVVVNADVFVGYDRRLLGVAAEMGFKTLSPGVTEAA